MREEPIVTAHYDEDVFDIRSELLKAKDEIDAISNDYTKSLLSLSSIQGVRIVHNCMLADNEMLICVGSGLWKKIKEQAKACDS